MVLITGGAGFIGRHLVALLALTGARDIRAFSRSPDRLFAGTDGTLRVALQAVERMASFGLLELRAPESARERAKHGVEILRDSVQPISADIRDAESLPHAMEGADAVLHTVAIIRETEGRTFQNTNVEGTRRVVEAARQVGVRRFLMMSILSAVDDPRLPYARSRWLAERIVIESGLDYTILKPSLVLGVADAFTLRLIRAVDFSRPLVVLPDGGKARFQPLWIGDMATILALCLRDPGTSGHSFELGGPEYVTFADFARRIARRLGKKRVYLPLPAPLLWPGVAATNLVFRDPPATFDELKQLRVDNYTSLDAVQRQFGFTPLPLEDYLDYVREVARAKGRGPSEG